MSKALRVAGGVCFVDWAVKLAHPLLWNGWVPHYTHRALWMVPLGFVLLVAALWMLGTTFAAVAGGLAFGGFAANIIDSAADGTVWNMIPVPYGRGLWCNVADFALLIGSALLLFECVRINWTTEKTTLTSARL